MTLPEHAARRGNATRLAAAALALLGVILCSLALAPRRHGGARTIHVTLHARARKLVLDGAPIDGMVFNDDYVGPVIHGRPGDTLFIRLVNQLREPTNLHFHGIQSSPLGHGDNIGVLVPPGGRFVYRIDIPRTQPPGLYWYHAHIHGAVEHQVMAGLSGALMIDGFAEQFPELRGTAEQLLVLKDVVFDDDTGNPRIDDELHGMVQTINGSAFARIRMRPGERQLWRISNQSADQYFHLAVPGLRFAVIGEDSVPTGNITEVAQIDIKPAARMDVLVTAGAAGQLALMSRRAPTGKQPDRVLGTVDVAGPPMPPAPAFIPRQTSPDLSPLVADRRRTFVFTQKSLQQQFLLNGLMYDHNRIDARVPLGSIEDWEIRNETDDFHEFHIHQLHFQVVAINGVAVPFEGYRDVVRIPERGSVTLRLAFTRPEILGRFVFHCHVVKHEDHGMMMNIEVYDPNAPVALDRGPSWLGRLLGLRGPLEQIPICRV